MIIETKRLSIRTFQEKDFADTLAIYKDNETCRYLLHDPWTSETAQDFFKVKISNNQLKQDQMLNLAVVSQDKVIGDLYVWYTDMRDTVELGYSFNRAVSGNGFATEALQELIHVLFEEIDIHRIQVNIDSRNSPSKKLCERLGMRKEGYFIADYWNKGEWTNSLVFGMLYSDFLKSVGPMNRSA
ncbi:Protein N-acetyltransferase, RimJ/RimL family [Marinilactibacillus piezotolerans]|uniref:Protein N-acetyltransferase, RimJ/RimL family n=1 Tax=Marinilactibacillus piezotolerans TaxID=258723 RepID=A0A1I3XYA7_9LACT|nr:GNAT family N-acetyltransferase [Marinilactibacillus piezotolerans]SFK24041.1 Protein N-acetyltransferase, RimJ/RimL family [Marinilactibacillus piezotolerans]